MILRGGHRKWRDTKTTGVGPVTQVIELVDEFASGDAFQ